MSHGEHRARDREDSFRAGFGLGVLYHILGQTALGLLGLGLAITGAAALHDLGWFPMLFFGFSQLLYMIPAALWHRFKGERKIATVLWIMTGIGFLLTSLCTAAVRTSLSNMH